MAKQKRKYFTVSGGGSFPYDMLRYDHCWPAHEDESCRLSDNEFIGARELRSVTLVTDSEYAPTLGRWRSFGWEASAPRATPNTAGAW